MEKKLLTNGNTFKRTDGRWCGVVWYMDENGERQRRSFSGKTKTAVQEKITAYITAFYDEPAPTYDIANTTLQDGMQHWLEVFKFPAVERTTYDRLECTSRVHIYPTLGKRLVLSITATDLRTLLNKQMHDGYAYTTVKKTHDLLGEYFRHLAEEEQIPKNPMIAVPMIKKANFLASQGKEYKPTCETVTVFTPDELECFKAECFRTWGTGKPLYQQSAAYIFMLNTGLRTGEMLGLLNSDIDLENRTVQIVRGVKEVARRDGKDATSGREVIVGNPKSATSRRVVPLNNTAIEMVHKLREEAYFGENTPLVPDSNGDVTRPVNFRKRYYRILEAAGIETKGLHTLRHTFATTLINGIKQPDGTVRQLTPREVADLLGHTTSEITERYYVKRDLSRLNGITDGFEM